jgi:hypothetical protein
VVHNQPFDGGFFGFYSKRKTGFPSVGEAARDKILDLTDGPRFINIIKKRGKEEI